MTITDMSEYAGTSFVKLVDLQRDGPRKETIADCTPGNYGPELIFASGDVISLNKNSIRALRKAYGDDARAWVDKDVRVYAGKVPYKDGETDAALVEPISPATSDGKLSPPKPKAAFDDDIPY